jgi:hypothetical protein
MAAPEVKKNSYQDGLLVYWKNDKKNLFLENQICITEKAHI